MSLINRVLRELDERQALAEGGPPLQEVRPVNVAARTPRGEWFWRTLAVLMLASVVWVGWVAWQLWPRPLVTEAGLAAGEKARLAGAAVEGAPSGVVVSPQVSAVPPAASAVAEGQAGRSGPGPEPAQPIVGGALRIAPEIETPERRRKQISPSAKAGSGLAAVEGTAPSLAPTPSAAPSRAPLELGVPPARILPPPARAAKLERKERELDASARAEREFRRAVALLRDGRPGEAESVFASALALDSSHEAARQALAALKLERRRLDEAQKLLEEGLALNPRQLTFAMALARLHAERKDWVAAFAVLEGFRESLVARPEHAQLLAAVEQRLGRHAQAAELLRAVLEVDPGNAAAWYALGVSLDELGRGAEAAEAFRRALAAGSLPADAAAHAEARGGGRR